MIFTFLKLSFSKMSFKHPYHMHQTGCLSCLSANNSSSNDTMIKHCSLKPSIYQDTQGNPSIKHHGRVHILKNGYVTLVLISQLKKTLVLRALS